MDFATGFVQSRKPELLIHSVNGKLTGSFLGGVPAIKIPVGEHEIGVSYVRDKRFSLSAIRLPKATFEKGKKYLATFESDYRGNNNYTLVIEIEEMSTGKKLTTRAIERKMQLSGRLTQ
ncbi:MAG: hypothetical protein VST69_07570 [Nitrospirota bacterium]|nr:hypothetical protein [Nitrospirota bacterium]